MKKLALTIAIVLGLSMTTFAENGGGLFRRGAEPDGTFGTRDENAGILLPTQHGADSHSDANTTPLGSGVVMLLGLGAAYFVGKKRNEE